MSFMLLNSILFMLFKHPLTCGMTLLMQTILTAMITGLMNYNFWYSYILFLIMVGGMLILFIYMTSIASNEKFKFNNKLIIWLMLFFMALLILNMMDLFYMNYHNNLSNLKDFLMTFNNNMSMKKYFNFPNYLIMFSMIIYLFLTLIAIVKITNFSYGSLRQKF
uniref:NADH-ubiquinone oxidoreductase chain 6 n=1 Tax=Aphthona melancholica TaxID=1425519 RepID=A0A3G1GNP0_9CUCU|nr:NADH dehydrogenase subunit 6 [Aphthona melancholica]